MAFPKLLFFLTLAAVSVHDVTAEIHYGLRYRDSFDRDQGEDATILSLPDRPKRVQRQQRRHLHGRRRLDDCVTAGKGSSGKAGNGKAGKAERRKLDCDDPNRTYPPMAAGKGGGASVQVTDDFVPFDDDTVVEPVVTTTGDDPAPAEGVSNDPIDGPPGPPTLDTVDEFSNDGLDTTPGPSVGAMTPAPSPLTATFDDLEDISNDGLDTTPGPSVGAMTPAPSPLTATLDDLEDISNDGLDTTPGPSPGAMTPAPSPLSATFDDLEDISNDGLDAVGDRQGGGGFVVIVEEGSEDETVSNDPRQSNDPGFIP